jgi:hypothetical protein
MTIWRKKKAELSPAELDLRLLSQKTSQTFKLSKFHLFLGNNHLVVPWVTFLMFLSYGLQIAVLAWEEISNFAVGPASNSCNSNILLVAVVDGDTEPFPEMLTLTTRRLLPP